MNKSRGFIFLHRRLLENAIAKKPAYAWLWVTLLLQANHEDHEFIWNNQKQICKRGQVMTGRDALSLNTGIPGGTVENILNYLESEQQIKQQKTTKYRLITILNYDLYQSIKQQNGQQGNNRVTTDEQQSDTNKNDKTEENGKELKKELRGGGAPAFTWRDSFEIYKTEELAAYELLKNDPAWIAEQQKFNPNLDIPLSLEKAHTQFWGKEDGWLHKKKSKSVELNWQSTFTKAIDRNKVYKQRDVRTYGKHDVSLDSLKAQYDRLTLKHGGQDGAH